MNFEKLMGKVKALICREGIDTCIIGRSVQRRAIYAFHVGTYDGDQIIITGAIHAREWITALLLVEMVKNYAGCNNHSMAGIYFVPLCNPDGVKIALEGKKLWKANARGVDLNVNFDADWGGGAQNVRVVGSENYIGPHANSEPEVQALIDFTRRVKPRATVAYHSKGEVIYHGFESKDGRVTKEQLAHCAELARAVGTVTGYMPEKTANSAGGYSDWVMMHLGVPAITVEVGNDDYSHPIGVDKLPEIWAQNKGVPRAVSDAIFY